MKPKQKEIELLVFNVLSESEKSRNSDTFLILKIAERFGHNIKAIRRGDKRIVQWELDLDLMPPFESITRARRKIQSGGQYLPTNPEVCRQRRINETKMREYYARRL